MPGCRDAGLGASTPSRQLPRALRGSVAALTLLHRWTWALGVDYLLGAPTVFFGAPAFLGEGAMGVHL